MTGFSFRWAYDVTVAMMFDPPNDAAYTPVVENQKVPHRIAITNHYNVLSPSGQGANQVRACRDCTFTRIFSHGGVALRVETDGIRTIGTDCRATGANGVGFKEFAIVDGLRAQRIEGAYGNHVAMFTPPCLPNGTASVTDILRYP